MSVPARTPSRSVGRSCQSKLWPHLSVDLQDDMVFVCELVVGPLSAAGSCNWSLARGILYSLMLIRLLQNPNVHNGRMKRVSLAASRVEGPIWVLRFFVSSSSCCHFSNLWCITYCLVVACTVLGLTARAVSLLYFPDLKPEAGQAARFGGLRGLCACL